MDPDDYIGTLPISEWQCSVRHIFFRYRNNRCRCRMSPTFDVDAHLCTQYTNAHLDFCGDVNFSSTRCITRGGAQFTLFLALPSQTTHRSFLFWWSELYLYTRAQKFFKRWQLKHSCNFSRLSSFRRKFI
jgi:hypothetical protein